MAVCKLSKDILRTAVCDYSLKQVTDLYFANYADVTATAVGADSSREISTITMASEAKFYHLEPNKDSVSYNDDLQLGDAGSKYRASSITFSLGGKYDSDAVNALDALSLGRYVIVAALSDGTHIMFGRQVPMEASAASFQSAAEATGFNGTTYTFTANTNESPLPLSEAAIKTVKGIA